MLLILYGVNPNRVYGWIKGGQDNRLVQYAKPGRRETKKRRAVVPINTTALAALQSARFLGLSDYVIEWNGRKVKSIKTGFRNAYKEVGIADCSPHVLRPYGSKSHGHGGRSRGRSRALPGRQRDDGREGLWEALPGLPETRGRCAGGTSGTERGVKKWAKQSDGGI